MNKCPFCGCDPVPFGDGIDRVSGLVTKQIQHPFLDNGCPLSILVFRVDKWNERPLIQSALAERTEQCAKILEDKMAIMEKANEMPALESLKQFIAGAEGALGSCVEQIRALNQPENKS